MKNAAVKAMIVRQFNKVDESQVNVEFIFSIGNKETYNVKLVDTEGEYREFVLEVEMTEVSL